MTVIRKVNSARNAEAAGFFVLSPIHSISVNDRRIPSASGSHPARRSAWRRSQVSTHAAANSLKIGSVIQAGNSASVPNSDGAVDSQACKVKVNHQGHQAHQEKHALMAISVSLVISPPRILRLRVEISM